MKPKSKTTNRCFEKYASNKTLTCCTYIEHGLFKFYRSLSFPCTIQPSVTSLSRFTARLE